MNETFRQQVLTYFRKGMLSRYDQLAAMLSMNSVFKKNAGKIARQYQAAKNIYDTETQKQFSVKKYNGSNPTAIKIREYLSQHSSAELIGVYVHGSIATAEEVGYSDFDGLVIVKHECMQDSDRLLKLFLSLKESEKMMLEMDPLQHHGWFVLTEADLNDYPENYFPSELFNHAATLFGEEKLLLHLRREGYSIQFLDSFNKLSNSILTKLSSESYLQNYYVFKNLLSECMLLPAIYIQAKTGNGIFKKYSFTMLEKEVVPDYNVMNSISEFREQWNYIPPTNYLEQRRRNWFTKNSQASHSGLLSDSIRNSFTNGLAVRMKSFVHELQNRIGHEL